MPFTRETARKARARSHGLHRAAFRRALGWPNLQRARMVHQLNASERRLSKVEAMLPELQSEIGGD
jgi:hypothetical protein